VRSDRSHDLTRTGRRSFSIGGALALLGLGVGCGRTQPGPAVPSAPPPPGEPRAKPATPPASRALGLPPRPGGALGARALFDAIGGLGAGERERRVGAELLAGNVPTFMRTLIPITVRAKEGGGRSATVFVTPDYLHLGSDDDFVRIAITMRSAHKVAALAGAVLPTRKLVDDLYATAPLKIPSPRMNAGAGRPEDVLAHHEIIEKRRLKAGGRLGQLVAGCKKDVVISKRMLDSPGRTAIYGWFLEDGTAIQGLSLVHDDRFLDYVQGIRLVDRRVWIEGRDVDLLDALADPDLAPLLSDEGSFDLRFAWERGH
jgi:hypothetical protein